MFARLRASRPLQTVLAVGAVALLIIAAGIVGLLVELRARELEDTRRSLLNINALLAESTSRTFENVDLVLHSVLDAIRGGSETVSAEAVARLRSDNAFQEALANRVSGLPQLDAISIVDSAGRLVSYSRAFPIPDIDLSDRDHFLRLRAGQGEEPYISEPVQNRSTGEWTVYLARRIVSPDGRFLGAAYGGITLGFFERSYARLAVTRGTSISLWRLDGMLLARHPPMAGIGQRFETPAFRDIGSNSPPVVYESEGSAIDPRPRIIVRNVVQGFPAATALARTKADILRQVRQETIALLIVGALLAAAVIAVIVALMRQFWAYEAVAQAERERAEAVQGLGELEDQLRQSQKLEVIGQLTSGIAHDFNNLLTVVIGNLDRLARRSGDQNADLARYIEGARTGAERAAALSQRLLGFSRRQPVDAQRLDANDTVTKLTDLLQQALGRKAVLEVQLDPDAPPVRADVSGLETALLNLVVNARDAMPGGGTVTISTQAAAAGTHHPPGSLCLTVSDTGTGMAPGVLGRAFEPFFTTKEAGVGTGLGLAQVASFARDNGGTVGIDTKIDEGTRVTICLPAASPMTEPGHPA